MIKQIDKNKLAGILKAPAKKVIVVNSLKKAELLQVTLRKYFEKIANTDIISYDNFPSYLARPDLLRNGLKEPVLQEYSSVLYKAAEEIFDEKSYFAGYKDKPKLFFYLGNVTKEIAASGMDTGLFRKLGNSKKWEDIIRFLNKVKEIYDKEKFASPGVINKYAALRAKEKSKIIYLFEDALLTDYLRKLTDIISGNNEAYQLSLRIICGSSEDIKKLADIIKVGTQEEFDKIPEIGFLSFPQPIDEIREIIYRLAKSGLAGDSAVGIADYKGYIQEFKSVADELNIEVIYGGGLPLYSFKATRLFLSFMYLSLNQKSCQPLRDIVTSPYLNIRKIINLPDDEFVSRTRCREIISEHKMNRELKPFAEYLEYMLKNKKVKSRDENNYKFLKKLSLRMAEYLAEIEKTEKEKSFSPAPFYGLIDDLITGKEEASAVLTLKNLIGELEGDRFFLNDPARVEEKITGRIKDTMAGGKMPDGKSLYVSSIDGLSGMRFSDVAFIGLSDKAYSPGIPLDPIFLYRERTRLNDIAKVPAVDDYNSYVKNKRSGFYDIFDTASRNLIFSWSANENLTGERMMPSSYLFEIYRALKGVPGNIEELEEAGGLNRHLPRPYQLSPAGYIYEGGPPAGRCLELYTNLKNYKTVIEDGNKNDVSDYCGIMNDPQFKKDFQEYEFSPSGIAKIIKCPYNYALEKIFRLEAEDMSEPEPFEWLDVMGWGSLIHGVLSDFYRKYKGNLNGNEEELLGIGEAKLKEYKFDSPPPSESVYQNALGRLKKELRHFISHGLIFQDGYRPSYFEAAIGVKEDADTDSELFHKEAVTICLGKHKLKLRGQIDRIDQDKDGNLLIIDYKTGKDHTADKDIFKAKSNVQHILYPLLLREAFGEKLKIAKISAGYYFCTEKGKFEKKLFDTDEDKNREQFGNLFSKVFEILSSGKFPRNNNSCEYCDFNKVCALRKPDNPGGATLKYIQAVEGEVNR